MNKFWNETTRMIEPYTPGEQPKDKKYIKLNTNECPYPPAPAIQKLLIEYNCDDLRLYPDPEITQLRNHLAQYYTVQADEIFVGVGSDDVLAMIFMSFFNRGDKIYFPSISYSFYPVYSNLFSLNAHTIGLETNYTIDVQKYFHLDGNIVIANPNAPTGIALSAEKIESIIKNNPDNLVIIDEAYIDFGGESVVSLTHKYDNLLVVQTMSKSRALAGARIGYAIGNRELIAGLNKIKFSFNSYTLNRLSMLCGIAAIDDKEYFQEIVQKIIATREMTTQALQKLHFEVLPSTANFIFVRHPVLSGSEIYTKLREHGILVRYFKSLPEFLRISIGTDSEMQQFINTMTDIVKE